MSAGNRGGNASAAPAVDVLTVVAFDRHNPLTGQDQTVIGVVVAADDQALTIAPIADHHFRVTRDAVSVVTADDESMASAADDESTGEEA